MTGNILGGIGVLLTIIFGIYSIWAYRKSKRKVSLEFKNIQCYSLFRNDINRLNIELIYNKKTLTSELVLLKARIFNNGQADIDKNRIFSPLKIISTKDYTWLDTKITNFPTGSKANIAVLNSSEIQINWDLLKSNEYIEFESLIEVEKSTNSDNDKTLSFHNDLTFDFRITDLNNIQKEKKIPELSFDEKLLKNTYLISFITIVFGIVITLNEYIPQLHFIPDTKIYGYTISDGKTKKNVFFDYTYDNSLILKNTNNEIDTTFTVNDFNKKFKIEKLDKISSSKNDKLINKILGFLFLFMGLFLLIAKMILDKKINANKQKIEKKTD